MQTLATSSFLFPSVFWFWLAHIIPFFRCFAVSVPQIPKIGERKTRDNAELEGRIVLAPGEGQVEFRNVKIRPFGKW